MSSTAEWSSILYASMHLLIDCTYTSNGTAQNNFRHVLLRINNYLKIPNRSKYS
jgi:hypothetical protein